MLLGIVDRTARAPLTEMLFEKRWKRIRLIKFNKNFSFLSVIQCVRIQNH